MAPQRFRCGEVDLRFQAAPGREPEIDDHTDPDRIPYWSVVWDSSRILAEWLAAHPNTVRGQHVLELGCGVGLAGLTAAALGARVTHTDLFPEALAVAHRNARDNALTIRGVAADWRAWPLTARFPVILAADLLYERPLHAALLKVLEQALTPAGSIYLADPGRAMSAPFWRMAEQRRWSRSVVTQTQAAAIYRLGRKS